MKIIIPMSDIQIRPYNSGGKGGQHSNRSLNAIEATHLPTGIKATSSAKSQVRNRKTALKLLSVRLQAHYEQLHAKERYAAGTERVRTYHEIQDRVTDHRTGQQWSFRKTVGRGDLRGVIETTAGQLATTGGEL